MMSYDCYCDYEYPTVFSRTTPTARKDHHCGECGCIIQPGEVYERVFGVWLDCAPTNKTCERCHDLRQWVQNNVPCFCWCYGNMHDDAREAVEEAAWRAPAETVGLRFGFLRRLHALQKHALLSHRERLAA